MIQALPAAQDVWAQPYVMLEEWAQSAQKARHEYLIASWVGNGGRVVELGCGNGRFSTVLEYESYAGYDQSLTMLNAARALNPAIDVALIDIFNFVPDYPYDTVLMIDVAYHQNEPVQAVLRVLNNWYANRYFITLLVGDKREDLLNSTVVSFAEMMDLYDLHDVAPTRVYIEPLRPEQFAWVLIELSRE